MRKLSQYILTTAFILTIIFTSVQSVGYTSSLCPSSMDPDSVECLDYLRKQLADIANKQTKIEKSLKDEEYQQLSLQEKIEYMTNQINQTEKVIDMLEIQIAAQDVEIKLLSKEIQEKEDNLSILKQEIYTLKDNVSKRVTESYKYSFVSPLELFLESNNLDSILRKTKYLLETREKDRNSLEEYNSKLDDVKAEEVKLGEEKANLQTKRNDIETEKTELLSEKSVLDAQKSQKASLLAESERKEKEMLAQLDSYRVKQSSLDNAIMEYLAEHGESMANYGWVTKGTWIGRLNEGASGSCSTGTHLHFSIDKLSTSYWDGCGKVNVFGGYLTKSSSYWRQSATGWKYYYISSGSMRIPLGGNVILTGDGSTHKPSSSCPAPRYAIDITSTLWTNIPVYAAHDGNLWKGTDRCGDTYAVIENTRTGIRTAYFHLQ